jgi:tetratricopeptide (TPR) repeat protein
MMKRRTGIREGPFHFELEALEASGIEDKEKVNFYLNRLDDLCRQISPRIVPSSDPADTAKIIFQSLWAKKPLRYKPGGPFRLNEVIDAQWDRDSRVVGNCLGLTLLYHALLHRVGLYPEALYLAKGFGIGPHVLTILRTGRSSLFIENSLPNGFSYKGHTDIQGSIIWGDKELVSDLYLSIGNEDFEKERWDEALKNYEKAVDLNPRYEQARLNKMILLGKLGRENDS